MKKVGKCSPVENNFDLQGELDIDNLEENKIHQHVTPSSTERWVVAIETDEGIVKGEIYLLIEVLDGGGSAIIVNENGEHSLYYYTQVFLNNVL